MKSNNLSVTDKILNIVMVLFTIVIIIYGGYFIYDEFKKRPIEKIFTYQKKDIIFSVSSDTRIEGHFTRSFTVGTGYINQNEYYFVFIKDSTGGYIKKGFPVTETVVYEDTTTVSNFIPYVEHSVGLRVKFDRMTKDTLSKEEFDLDGSGYFSNVRSKLHVPKGTIIQEFKL